MFIAYNPLGQKLSRRNFLSYALKGAAGLVVYSSVGWLAGCSSEKLTAIPNKPIYTIRDVRAGFVEPSVYVAQMSSSMPEIQDAKKNGMMKDVLYNPAEKEIEQITAEIMASRGYGQSVIRSSVDAALDVYLTSKNRQGNRATVSPLVNLLFGAHVPIYIVFVPGFIQGLETDEEFRMTARHELRHINDFYNGITLGNLHITGTVPGVDGEFITNLGELRATHDTSMSIYQAFKITGRLPVTPDYFGNELDHYASYWKLVKKSRTATESMLADLQLAEFSDITPEELGEGTIKTTFSVSGKKESLIVKRAE